VATTIESSVQGGERLYSLEDAAHRVQAAMDELGLTPHLTNYNGDPTAYRCDLHLGGQPVREGRGHGKGSPATARVGALYESLEHYLTQTPMLVADNITLVSCADLAQSALGREAYSGAIADQPQAQMACRIYRAVNGDDTIAIPIFLSYTWWVDHEAAPLRTCVGDTADYQSLMRYSSNNGSAIGGNLAEALVHGINEIIERDAMSLFLIQTYISEKRCPPRFLHPESLPVELYNLLDNAQSRLGHEIALIDITSDIGVPTTLAYAYGMDVNYVRGYGTSLSRQHSVARAISELVQIWLTDDQQAARCTAIEALADYPALHACAKFNLPRPTPASLVTFEDTDGPATPDEHLDTLISALQHRGFRPYYSTSHTASNGIATTHVHVPGLEHFDLVLNGPIAVAPGHRGIAAANNARSAE
jgi:ribosomal protein S12 methylthiotransferase accessory factor